MEMRNQQEYAKALSSASGMGGREDSKQKAGGSRQKGRQKSEVRMKTSSLPTAFCLLLTAYCLLPVWRAPVSTTTGRVRADRSSRGSMSRGIHMRIICDRIEYIAAFRVRIHPEPVQTGGDVMAKDSGLERVQGTSKLPPGLWSHLSIIVRTNTCASHTVQGTVTTTAIVLLWLAFQYPCATLESK